jgi:pyruvate carboxylase
VGAAAKAGAHIVDTGIGAAVRWYGQGEVLSTAAYIEDELGLKTNLNKDMIRECNFVLKQIMPYYDRYTTPFFQGIDHDVVEHGMPGGATSSSQEGAMKQGYIHLLPYMLKFLAGTRKIVRYHDVTPGSQITWNTAFLAVSSAYKRGGENEVKYLLSVLDEVNKMDACQDCQAELAEARLALYQDSNDAFRDLLLGKFGKLPLGFPPDWVYQSAFGDEWKQAIASRTEQSPLETLKDIDLVSEEKSYIEHMKRKPTDEEFVMYLNHPADALKTVQFRNEFGNPNQVPLDVWFEGLELGRELQFVDSNKKPHTMTILHKTSPDKSGKSVVRYVLDSEILSYDVQVALPQEEEGIGYEKADKNNTNHVAAPSNGDLWVMYVHPGDLVKKGEELFNISIMKQEKAVLAPADGMVVRVLKTADFKENKVMVPVKEGELLVELGPVPRRCPNEACQRPLTIEGGGFCPFCGVKLEA